MIPIYNYTDYRAFLRDLFEHRKKGNPGFTYQVLAQKVGFRSRGYFTQVLQGKTKISDRLILKFAKAFGLKKKESDFFELLVHFNQAKSHRDKKNYFEKIISLHSSRIKTVEPEQYEFYDKWYYSAVRSLLGYYSFRGNFEALAGQLDPPITSGQAKKSIRLLERLGMIEKGEDGCCHLKNRLITTGDQVRSVAIPNFQIATMNLAKDALERFPKTVRSSSTLTLGLSKTGYNAAQEKIANLRKELIEIAKFDKNIDRVYQVNLHAFPMTKFHKEKKS